MPQFHPAQYGVDKDMNIWQQQLMYKQFQELQRQQLQQPVHGNGIQNSMVSLNASARLAGVDQSAMVFNEMTSNVAPNYDLPNNIGGADPRYASNPQMHAYGNMSWDTLATNNFSNGLFSSNSNTQYVRSAGFVPQKYDQIPYPMLASINRGAGNQYSQYLGAIHERQSVTAKLGVEPLEKVSRVTSSPNSIQSNESFLNHAVNYSTPTQNFQGRGGFLNSASVQNLDRTFESTPFPADTMQNNLQPLGSSSQIEGGWFGNLQDRRTMEQHKSRSGASLDPEEAKILFGGDNNTKWGAFLEGDHTSTGEYNRPSLNSESFGACPSLQSGSWSALMQEALDASTSENVILEERSGLSLNNAAWLSSNSLNVHYDGGKNQTSTDINLQSASTVTTRSFPLHNNSDRSISSPTFPNSEQSVKFFHEQNMKFLAGSSSTIVQNQQPPAEVNKSFFHQSQKQKKSNICSRQQHVDSPNGGWQHQSRGRLEGNTQPADSQTLANDSQGTLITQQEYLGQHFAESNLQQSRQHNSYSDAQGMGGSTDILNSWKVSSDAISLTSSLTPFRMHRQTYIGNNVAKIKSNMQMDNLQQDSQTHFAESSHCKGDSTSGTNLILRAGGAQTSASSENDIDVRSNMHNQDYAPLNEGHGHISNQEQHASGGLAYRMDSVHDVNNVNSLRDSNQNFTQPVQPYILHNNLFGSTVGSFGPMAKSSPHSTHMLQLPNKNESTQNLPMPIHVQFSGNIVSEKHIAEMQSREETHNSQHSAHNNEFNGSFVIPDVQIKNKLSQSSENMLGLSQKVDQSTRGMPKNLDNAFGSSSCVQQLKPPTQGMRLQLGPAQQRQSTSSQLLDNVSVQNLIQESLPLVHPNASPYGSSDLVTGEQVMASNNIWRSMSDQAVAAMQLSRVPPNILQTMLCSNKGGDVDLDCLQKGDETHKGLEASFEATTSLFETTSATAASAGKMNVGSTGGKCQESTQNTPLNLSAGVSAHSLANLHQHSFIKLKSFQGSLDTCPNISDSSAGASSPYAINGHVMPNMPNLPLDASHQNCSLLRQMQAMKHSEINPSSKHILEPAGVDFGSEPAQSNWKPDQRSIYGQNNSIGASTDNSTSPHVHNSHASGSNMITLASRDNDERSSSSSGLLRGRESPCIEIAHAQTIDHLNNNFNPAPAYNALEKRDQASNNSQMAPMWPDQHAIHKSAQTLAAYNAQKNECPLYNQPRVPWNANRNNFRDHGAGTSHSEKLGLCLAKGEGPLQHRNTTASLVVARPRKRKFTPRVLLSWHKVVEHPQKVQSLSIAELDWAQAANRLTEKIEFEDDFLEEGHTVHPVRRRLIRTTLLMQQLLPAIPFAILKASAASSYESITYATAKLALGDACGVLSLSMSRSDVPDDENKLFEQVKRNERVAGSYFSKVAEVYVRRFEQIKNSFTRLDKRTSLLDVQLECQELERFSIVNRLGKYHGRSQADGAKNSLNSESISRRAFMQRHVVSFPMPGNPPEGIYCLSL